MHHAYIYEGSLSIHDALVASAKAAFGFEEKGTVAADIHIYSYEKLNIEEARALTSEASFTSVSGRALYVITASSISFDAQQALLKLFEEPPEGVIFVMLTPPGSLMQTLRSRFAEYPEHLEEHNVSAALSKKFLSSSNKERSTQIAALLKDEEGVKERVRDFLNSTEKLVYAAHTKKPGNGLRASLEDIQMVRGYLGDRSASLKMLLEHLAMALPIL
jgi:hypothetical protein